MAKFVTDASGATWWPNLEPMQVAFFLLAEEITQVKEAIPWVRCASGNVYVSRVRIACLFHVARGLCAFLICRERGLRVL